MPQLLAARFAAAQEAGELNPDLDPRLLVTSLIGSDPVPRRRRADLAPVFDADDIDASPCATTPSRCWTTAWRA
jgi:hypothetical protein